MDTALILRKKVDNKEMVTNPMSYLEQSELIKKYNELDDLTYLGNIFALCGLAEIPFAEQLPVTQKLLAFINKNIATKEGFSFTGKLTEIVPCYNALLLDAYCSLGLGQTKEAQNALNWIKQYQVFDRHQQTAWKHPGICKFGGCMKKTPCYIGIGKTVRALLTYQEKVASNDQEVNQLITSGVEYMLRHQMFKRLSTPQPISAHITDNMFPQSYALSLTDLVYILKKSGTLINSQATSVLSLLEETRTKTNGWKIDFIYKYNGYIPFDNRRKDSEWLTYLYSYWLT